MTGDAPVPVRIAYAAYLLHPDLFTEEWANEKNKEYFEKFTDLDIDFSNLHFLITYDMVKGSS